MKNRPKIKLDTSYAANFHKPVSLADGGAAGPTTVPCENTTTTNLHDTALSAFKATKIESWGLWVGSVEDAKNSIALRHHGITHVLNAAMECDSPGSTTPSSTPMGLLGTGSGTIRYLHLPLRDHGDEALLPYILPAIAFIEEGRRLGGSVLVYCRQGISRSPAVCISYIMVRTQSTFVNACDTVTQKRDQVNPNLGFVLTLTDFERVMGSVSETLRDTEAKKIEYMSDVVGTLKDNLLSTSPNMFGKEALAWPQLMCI